jgi:hypothetical protein
MAVQTWEEILAGAQLSAEERKVLDNAVAKVPSLKEGWLRQDDYSRKTQELATERKQHEADLEYATRMKTWEQDTWPKIESLYEKGILDKDTGEELWTVKQAELEKQIEEAKKAAAVGGDMDLKELDKIVRGIVKDAGGDLTKEQISALYANEGNKLAQKVFDENWTKKEADFNANTIPMVAGFAAGTAILASRYEKETGEPWTPDKQKELFTLMNKEQNFDPYAVGEKMLEPVRAKKSEEARIEAEVQKRIQSMGGLPGGGGDDGRYIPGPGAAKGSLQLALERTAGDGDFESLIKAQSVLASKELVQEGKG